MDLPSIEGVSLDFVVVTVVVGAAVFIGILSESNNAVVRLLFALRDDVLAKYPKLSAFGVAVIHIGFVWLCLGTVGPLDVVNAGLGWLISFIVFSKLE